MVSYKNISVAIILSLASANCFATDLFDMLKRMSEADQSQNYQGTFILRKSDNLSTMHVAHGANKEGIWERMESLNGENKKILRYNNRIISIYPNRKLVTIRQTKKPQSLHLQLPENIDQLELFYSMNRLDDDRIANHKTFVVDLIPRDKYRYGYRYWIDKETGMLLRCDLVSEKKEIIEQMMFTSLEYLTDEAAKDFDKQQFERLEQQVRKKPEIDYGNSVINWQVKMLPKGFMLTQNTMRYLQSGESSESSDTKVENDSPDLQHLVYSDGLASVSVFIETNKGDGSHFQGASSMGAVNAFGYSRDKYFVTVVGEVPEETVQLIAQSAVRLP